jgi:hypothetical protein
MELNPRTPRLLAFISFIQGKSNLKIYPDMRSSPDDKRKTAPKSVFGSLSNFKVSSKCSHNASFVFFTF